MAGDLHLGPSPVDLAVLFVSTGFLLILIALLVAAVKIDLGINRIMKGRPHG